MTVYAEVTQKRARLPGLAMNRRRRIPDSRVRSRAQVTFILKKYTLPRKGHNKNNVLCYCRFVAPYMSVSICRHRNDGRTSRESMRMMFLVGRWWTFWAVGVRLFIAGLRQVTQPRFTAEEIFGIYDTASFPIVREIGFGNLSMGAFGICSIFSPAVDCSRRDSRWSLLWLRWPCPRTSGRNKNSKEYTAMVSDIFVAVLLSSFLVAEGSQGQTASPMFRHYPEKWFSVRVGDNSTGNSRVAPLQICMSALACRGQLRAPERNY